MNWMDELADEMFDKAFKAATKQSILIRHAMEKSYKEMRNEFRKDKIRRIFNTDM
jgi:hypothetical protein